MFIATRTFLVLFAVLVPKVLGGVLESVTINEILPVPADGNFPFKFDTNTDGSFNQKDEFIEIYNKGSAAINIGGVQIWDQTTKGNSNIVFQFPGNTMLPAGSFAIVVASLNSQTLTLPSGSIAFEALHAIQFRWLSRCCDPSRNIINFGSVVDGVSNALATDGDTTSVVAHNALPGFDISPPASPGTTNIGADSRLKDIVFNEIYADPEGTAPEKFDTNADGDVGQDDEFIEIYNKGAAAVDISNFELYNKDGLVFTIPAGTMLPSMEFAVIVKSMVGEAISCVPSTAKIFSAAGTKILFDDQADIVLVDPGRDEFIQAYYGTNTPATDIYDQIGDMSKSAVIRGSVELFGTVVPGKSQALTPDGVTGSAVTHDTITLPAGADVDVLASPGTSNVKKLSALNTVVFNEILGSPNGATDKVDTNRDGDINQRDEFIELYNTGSCVDVSGLEFWHDSAPNKKFTIPENTVLEEGGFLLLVSDLNSEVITLPDGSVVFEAGESNGYLTNSGDNILLLDPKAQKYAHATYGAGEAEIVIVTALPTFPSSATVLGSVLAFGATADGVSVALFPDGIIANPIAHNAIPGFPTARLASPGTANVGASNILASIVINEILPNPNGASLEFDTSGNGNANQKDEFVEIYNTGTVALDISGIEFWVKPSTGGTSRVFTVPPGTMLGARQFAVLVNDLEGNSIIGASAGTLVFEAKLEFLVNDADDVVLYDPAANEYIHVVYGSKTPYDPAADFNKFPTTAVIRGEPLLYGIPTDGVSLSLFRNGNVGSSVLHNTIGDGTIFATPGSSNTAPTVQSICLPAVVQVAPMVAVAAASGSARRSLFAELPLSSEPETPLLRGAGRNLQNGFTTCGEQMCVDKTEDCVGGECICKVGLVRGEAGTCEDEDECKIMKPCPSVGGFCVDYDPPSRFKCGCLNGFTPVLPASTASFTEPVVLEWRPLQCIDINECDDATLNNCSPDATCANTVGSFQCSCNEGTVGNGITCAKPSANTDSGVDSGNECSDRCANPGDEYLEDRLGQVCAQLDSGTFECICDKGYRSLGNKVNSKCFDINECEEKSDNCAEDAKCVNIPGSFFCQGATPSPVTPITSEPSAAPVVAATPVPVVAASASSGPTCRGNGAVCSTNGNCCSSTCEV